MISNPPVHHVPRYLYLLILHPYIYVDPFRNTPAQLPHIYTPHPFTEDIPHLRENQEARLYGLNKAPCPGKEIGVLGTEAKLR